MTFEQASSMPHAEKLKQCLLALNEDASLQGKTRRAAAARMFTGLSELLDTAMIRTPGIVEQLWSHRGKHLQGLHGVVA
jgi:hypothetical protein